MYGLIILAVVTVVIIASAFVKAARPGSSRPMWCPNCGATGAPVTVARGSIGWEIVLWLLFLLPGVLYSVWRLTTRYRACPICAAPNMVPLDSPRALAARAQRPPA